MLSWETIQASMDRGPESEKVTEVTEAMVVRHGECKGNLRKLRPPHARHAAIGL